MKQITTKENGRTVTWSITFAHEGPCRICGVVGYGNVKIDDTNIVLRGDCQSCGYVSHYKIPTFTLEPFNDTHRIAMDTSDATASNHEYTNHKNGDVDVSATVYIKEPAEDRLGWPVLCCVCGTNVPCVDYVGGTCGACGSEMVYNEDYCVLLTDHQKKVLVADSNNEKEAGRTQ